MVESGYKISLLSKVKDLLEGVEERGGRKLYFGSIEFTKLSMPYNKLITRSDFLSIRRCYEEEYKLRRGLIDKRRGT